jgi:hypothetical protein
MDTITIFSERRYQLGDIVHGTAFELFPGATEIGAQLFNLAHDKADGYVRGLLKRGSISVIANATTSIEDLEIEKMDTAQLIRLVKADGRWEVRSMACKRWYEMLRATPIDDGHSYDGKPFFALVGRDPTGDRWGDLSYYMPINPNIGAASELLRTMAAQQERVAKREREIAEIAAVARQLGSTTQP